MQCAHYQATTPPFLSISPFLCVSIACVAVPSFYSFYLWPNVNVCGGRINCGCCHWKHSGIENVTCSRAHTPCNRRHSKQLLARISVRRVWRFFVRFSIGSRFLLHSSAFNSRNFPELMRRVIGELAHSCVIHFTWILFGSFCARTPIRLIQCNGMRMDAKSYP